MAPRVLPPDIESVLTVYLRDTLRALGYDVQVGNKEPGDALRLPLTRPLIVVRDDGGAAGSWITFQRTVGVSVLAGTRLNDKPAKDLARLVYALLADDQLLADGSDIAAINLESCLGPTSVPDAIDVSRQYMSVEYIVMGSWES